MIRLEAACSAIALIAMLSAGKAWAQLDQAIPAKDLVEPWDRAREVLLSLAHLFDVVDEQNRHRVERDLTALDDELSELESQEETVAIQIVSNPAFAFDVSLSSDRMSTELSEISKALDLLFRGLTISRRPDVLAVQESVDSLRRSLSDKNRLERDVLRALGSGSKNEIQALAARWWEGSESVGRLRETVAGMRRELVPPTIDKSRH
jgi:hypothetical protein